MRETRKLFSRPTWVTSHKSNIHPNNEFKSKETQLYRTSGQTIEQPKHTINELSKHFRQEDVLYNYITQDLGLTGSRIQRQDKSVSRRGSFEYVSDNTNNYYLHQLIAKSQQENFRGNMHVCVNNNYSSSCWLHIDFCIQQDYQSPLACLCFDCLFLYNNEF